MSIAKLRANVAQHEYATGITRADLEAVIVEYYRLKTALERIKNEWYTCADKNCCASIIASKALEPPAEGGKEGEGKSDGA